MNVGFPNISNKFHDPPNYSSGSRGFSKFTEIGFTNILHRQELQNTVPKTCVVQPSTCKQATLRTLKNISAECG